MNKINPMSEHIDVLRELLDTGDVSDWQAMEAALSAAIASLSAKGEAVADIDAMVNRFLGWPLPKTFGPDCGVSFTPPSHPNSWPVGTNLLTAVEARAMFAHCLSVERGDIVHVEPVAIVGADDAHQVRIRTGVQRFDVGGAWDTREEAEWFAGQLRHALLATHTQERKDA